MEDSAGLRALLAPDAVAIISASCCAPMASDRDEALKMNLEAALQQAGRDDGYAFISITEAQRQLPKLQDELEPAELRLVNQVQMLVSTQGFAIFPILIVGRKVAFYGGIPTPAMIRDKLGQIRVEAL